ncbi:MAG: hypothetical protein EBU84_20700, partial [Actinobacteria bacterium]|nr:hypothetical protein [Actinomycetota bacterium]
TSPAHAAQPRVTLCHRTRSTTNPYRLITVAQGGINGHNGHTASPQRVWNSGLANGDAWGDIIPGNDSDGDLFWSDGSGQAAAAMNWSGSSTSGGKSFMLSGGTNAAKCVRMSALRFYEVMKAAGATDAQIATDLNEQSANEDAAMKPSGGWTAANVATAVGSISIKTNSPTAIGSTSATLSGTITAGSTSTTPKFEYGTTTSLGTTVSGGSTATGTINATASLSGLSSNTTYYFRVIGEIGSADTLGTYYGDILSFTTGKTLRTVTVSAASTTIATGQTTSLSTTVSAGSPGTTTYTVESGTLYCSISGSTLTADSTNTGSCKVRADDAGNSTYSASASASITITVTTPTSRTLTINSSSYAGSPYAFNAATKPTITSTASAGDGSGTKSYSSSTTSVCTINSSSG